MTKTSRRVDDDDDDDNDDPAAIAKIPSPETALFEGKVAAKNYDSYLLNVINPRYGFK